MREMRKTESRESLIGWQFAVSAIKFLLGPIRKITRGFARNIS